MFGEPDTPVLRLIQRGAKAYKHCYGEYPEMVGLDIFSRFREWQETNYLDTYYFREVKRSLPHAFGPDMKIVFTDIAIKVVPATFSPITYDTYTGTRVLDKLRPRPTDPALGQNCTWCKRGEHEVCMHLLFTERGYHAAIWEKSEMKLEQGAHL